RDHQVQHEVQVIVETPNDALAQAHQVVYPATVQRFNWRVEGAQEEGTDDLGFLEDLAPDARAEAFEVDGDVGEFGHATNVTRPSENGAPDSFSREPWRARSGIANALAKARG